jgi:hypothetical protein
MMIGQPALYLLAGIWNCTYIWAMVIWWGASGAGVAGGGVPGGGGGGADAWSVTFCTPPMKKLPWSSIVSGPVRNFFGFGA